MTREEYLRQLQHYLKRLPKEDYDSAMEYFTEYFEEAGPEGEQAVIAELGTPKQAAILFALVLLIASAVLCVLLLGVCGILVGGKLILIGLASAGSSVAGMCMLLGLGLLGIGLGILLSMVLIALCRMIGLLLLRLIQWILCRRTANR